MNESNLATFWEHLEALRKTIIKIFFIWLIGTIVAFYFSDSINDFLKSKIPKSETFSESLQKVKLEKIRIINNGQIAHPFQFPDTGVKVNIEPGQYVEYWSPESPKILLLSPVEGMTTSFKLSFWISIALTSPLWLYHFFLFFIPALNPREFRLIAPFFCLSLLFIVIGGVFCYAVTLPLANQYFVHFNQSIGINAWSFNHYADFVLLLFLGNGLAFESAALFFFLVHFGVVTEELMKENRRISFIAFLIIGAILTPPDVITQLFLAFPLMLFYEVGIFYARLLKRKSLASLATSN